MCVCKTSFESCTGDRLICRGKSGISEHLERIRTREEYRPTSSWLNYELSWKC